MLRDVRSFDIVFANRDVVPEIRFRKPETRIFSLKVPLVFDFDDAIHIGRRRDKIAWILENAAWSTPGNPYLAEFARKHCRNVIIVPTVVNTDLYVPKEQRKPGPLRIGWSGSASTNRHCLPLLKAPVQEVARRIEMEFIVISNEDPHIDWEGVKTRFYPWSEETEVETLRLLDIGAMPLEDRDFERGKCGLKAIQYMALGIPAVVSPVGVNSDIVQHGENGFHARNPEEWVKYLVLLAENEDLRERMGRRARERVISRYSHHVAADLITSCFEKILEENRRGQAVDG